MSFLRFVGNERDSRTGQPQGIMTLAYALLRSNEIGTAESEELHAHIDWVEHHLPVPTKFSRTRNVSHKETHGVAWVKADAAPAVSRFYAIADILGRHGCIVHATSSDRPGYIVYEDELQVVAEPFHGERR